MNPSNAAEVLFASLPERSWRTLKAAAAASTGLSGPVSMFSSSSIGTLPPSELAHALAAREPKLYAFYPAIRVRVRTHQVGFAIVADNLLRSSAVWSNLMPSSGQDLPFYTSGPKSTANKP